MAIGRVRYMIHVTWGVADETLARFRKVDTASVLSFSEATLVFSTHFFLPSAMFALELT